MAFHGFIAASKYTNSHLMNTPTAEQLRKAATVSFVASLIADGMSKSAAARAGRNYVAQLQKRASKVDAFIAVCKPTGSQA